MPRRNESQPTVGSTGIALFKQTGMENSKSPHLPNGNIFNRTEVK